MVDLKSKEVIAIFILIIAIIWAANSLNEKGLKEKEQRIERIEEYFQPVLEKQLDNTKIFSVRSGDVLVVYYFEPYKHPDIKIPAERPENLADAVEIITPESIQLKKLNREDGVSLQSLKLQHPDYIDRISN